MFFPTAHVDRLIVSASVALVVMVSTASGQTSGFTPLIALHTGSCLDVSGESLEDGASIIQWQCHNGDNQQWRLEAVVDGYSQIVARHSGKCLDVSGGSADDGASIIQWQCHGGANQTWLLLAPPVPPAPPTGSARLWVMVVDEFGGCIEGATIQIVRAEGAGDPIPQSTPCSIWDVDGGVLFRDLFPEELTLRGAAPGYAPREMRFLPVSGPELRVVFIELSR